MENGFYAARVADDGIRSVHVDEDTVYYLQTARLFRQRDSARAEKRQRADRKAARERKKRREMVRVCACWLGTGALVCAAYLLGPVAVMISAIACFGAACFKLGSYFRKEKTK